MALEARHVLKRDLEDRKLRSTTQSVQKPLRYANNMSSKNIFGLPSADMSQADVQYRARLEFESAALDIRTSIFDVSSDDGSALQEGIRSPALVPRPPTLISSQGATSLCELSVEGHDGHGRRDDIDDDGHGDEERAAHCGSAPAVVSDIDNPQMIPRPRSNGDDVSTISGDDEDDYETDVDRDAKHNAELNMTMLRDMSMNMSMGMMDMQADACGRGQQQQHHQRQSKQRRVNFSIDISPEDDQLHHHDHDHEAVVAISPTRSRSNILNSRSSGSGNGRSLAVKTHQPQPQHNVKRRTTAGDIVQKALPKVNSKAQFADISSRYMDATLASSRSRMSELRTADIGNMVISAVAPQFPVDRVAELQRQSVDGSVLYDFDGCAVTKLRWIVSASASEACMHKRKEMEELLARRGDVFTVPSLKSSASALAVEAMNNNINNINSMMSCGDDVARRRAQLRCKALLERFEMDFSVLLFDHNMRLVRTLHPLSSGNAGSSFPGITMSPTPLNPIRKSQADDDKQSVLMHVDLDELPNDIFCILPVLSDARSSYSGLMHADLILLQSRIFAYGEFPNRVRRGEDDAEEEDDPAAVDAALCDCVGSFAVADAASNTRDDYDDDDSAGTATASTRASLSASSPSSSNNKRRRRRRRRPLQWQWRRQNNLRRRVLITDEKGMRDFLFNNIDEMSPLQSYAFDTV